MTEAALVANRVKARPNESLVVEPLGLLEAADRTPPRGLKRACITWRRRPETDALGGQHDQKAIDHTGYRISHVAHGVRPGAQRFEQVFDFGRRGWVGALGDDHGGATQVAASDAP